MPLALLDLDGTLVDRERAVHRWAQEFVSTHAIDDADAVPFLVAADGDGLASRESFLSAVKTRFGLRASLESLVASFQERLLEYVEPVRGAAGGLRRLRGAGWALAIVENGGSIQQQEVERTGLGALVDAVVLSDLVDVAKPDPRIFELAAERAGTDLTGAWVVGDTPTHDISGAARLDLDTVWISRGRDWPEPGFEPTATARDFPAAVDVLLASDARSRH